MIIQFSPSRAGQIPNKIDDVNYLRLRKGDKMVKTKQTTAINIKLNNNNKLIDQIQAPSTFGFGLKQNVTFSNIQESNIQAKKTPSHLLRSSLFRHHINLLFSYHHHHSMTLLLVLIIILKYHVISICQVLFIYSCLFQATFCPEYKCACNTGANSTGFERIG